MLCTATGFREDLSPRDDDAVDLTLSTASTWGRIICVIVSWALVRSNVLQRAALHAACTPPCIDVESTLRPLRPRAQ